MKVVKLSDLYKLIDFKITVETGDLLREANKGSVRGMKLCDSRINILKEIRQEIEELSTEVEE